MKKIMVVGVSSGVGKSTFARDLGRQLAIEVFHLDALYWNPGWRPSSETEFVARQNQVMENECWIIEGNYDRSFAVRAEKADTIIYLELPLVVCLYRVVKRRLRYRGRTRPDMGRDCPEKIDWEFIKFILTTYRRRKREMAGRLDAFRKSASARKVYRLIGKRQIRAFLREVPGK